MEPCFSVAMGQDLARAEARLREVDCFGLIGWLDEAQRRADLWSRCYCVARGLEFRPRPASGLHSRPRSRK